MADPKTVTALRLPENLKRRIQGLAFRRDVTATSMIIDVLEKAFPPLTPFTDVGSRLINALERYDPALSDRDRHALLGEIGALGAQVAQIAQDEADLLAADAQARVQPI